MTPDQEKAAQLVATEVGGYRDQLIAGAPEQLGKLWGGIASQPPDRRAEEIARRMASPLVDRFRDPSYDPASDTDPVRTAIGRQAHRLRDGAAEELAGAWRIELAGRNPVALAGEIARRLGKPENAGFLKDPPPEPSYAGRLRTLMTANFPEMTPNGITGLIGDRGRQYQSMSDHMIIGQVATVMGFPQFAEMYGTGRTIDPGDSRRRGGGQQTTPARATVKPSAESATPNRDTGSGRFAAAEAPTEASRRRPSF